MTHLKTSACHPQIDAKCEWVHFIVHNMVTKLVGDKHGRGPDLLSTIALAYCHGSHFYGVQPPRVILFIRPSMSSGCAGNDTNSVT